MDKWHRGGLAVLCLLCAAVLDTVCLLPQPAAAKWHAGRPGQHYGTGDITPAAHIGGAGLPPLSAPPPTAGADLPPSLPPTQPAPHFGFPLQPTLGSAASPTAAAGEGYPFIGSNPTVPLPTGMTDTATVLPLPDTGDATTTGTKVVGLAPSVRVQVSMIGLGVIFTIVAMITGC